MDVCPFAYTQYDELILEFSSILHFSDFDDCWPRIKRSNMRIRPFFLVFVESGRVVEKWSRVLTSSRSTHAFCCCCWCCFLLHVSRDHDRRSSGGAATHFGKSRNFSLSNHSVTKSHENSFSDTYPGASSSLNLRYKAQRKFKVSLCIKLS